MDVDALRRLARAQSSAHRVRAGNIECASGMANDVISDGDIRVRTPVAGSACVARSELEGKSGLDLRLRPVIFEDVSLQENPLGVLDLKEILDGPEDPRITRAPGKPTQRLGEV